QQPRVLVGTSAAVRDARTPGREVVIVVHVHPRRAHEAGGEVRRQGAGGGLEPQLVVEVIDRVGTHHVGPAVEVSGDGRHVDTGVADEVADVHPGRHAQVLVV